MYINFAFESNLQIMTFLNKMFALMHCATFTSAKLQTGFLFWWKRFEELQTFFKTIHYVVNMSCRALMSWEVSSTQAPIADRPKYFTFACTILCYFAAHPALPFLPSRKFV